MTLSWSQLLLWAERFEDSRSPDGPYGDKREIGIGRVVRQAGSVPNARAQTTTVNLKPASC